MTAVKVVDASAVAAMIFNEEQGPFVTDRLRDVRLLAPTLLHYELTNVCLTKLRRHPENREELLSQFELLYSFPLEYRTIDHRSVLELAHSRRLSADDASYLWLAQTMEAELVTLDRRLAAAYSGFFSA